MQTITSTEFNRKPGATLDRVADEIIGVERRGKTAAVLISADSYQALCAASRRVEIERLERERRDDLIYSIRVAMDEARAPEIFAEVDRDKSDIDGLSIRITQVDDHEFVAQLWYWQVDDELHLMSDHYNSQEEIDRYYHGFDGAAERVLEMFEQANGEIWNYVPVEVTMREPDIDPEVFCYGSKPEIWLDEQIAVIRTFEQSEEAKTLHLSAAQVEHAKKIDEDRRNGLYGRRGDANFTLALLRALP